MTTDAPTDERRRAQRPARHPDQARRPDGGPGRRPRGQAPGPGRAIATRLAALRRRWPRPRSGERAGVTPAPARHRVRAARPTDGRCRRPSRGWCCRRPGGPAPRDRPGDARRPGPEPDEHRPPGPDRRAARRQATRRCAAGEVRQLVAMVQQTLDATKTFIFDVRPMVLDDLGLVPTLRRAARERGRRAGVPVEFESLGPGPAAADGPRERPVPDPRRGAGGLPRRAPGPGHDPAGLGSEVRCEARVAAHRRGRSGRRGRSRRRGRPAATADLPPALAAMIEDRRADARDAAEAAARESIVVLPPSTWREIQAARRRIGVDGRAARPRAPSCHSSRSSRRRPTAATDVRRRRAGASRRRSGPRRIRADPRPDGAPHGAHPRRVRRDHRRHPGRRSATAIDAAAGG